MFRLLLLSWFVFLSLKTLGQIDTTAVDTFAPHRVVLSLGGDYVQLTHPFNVIDLGVEVKIAKRISVSSNYGIFQTSKWFKGKTQRTNVYTLNQVRYYPKKNRGVSFYGFGYRYSEHSKELTGTFPTSNDAYSKTAQIYTSSHSYFLMAGNRSFPSGRFQLEMFFGVGLRSDNNHIKGLSEFELMLIERNLITEFENESGTQPQIHSDLLFNVRLAYAVLR